MEYSDYQNQPSSEKVTLVILSAAKRLMGWSVHSGSVYKIENFNFNVIASIEDSGTAYTEAANVGAVTASKYFLDRSARTLYLRTTGSDDPNTRFIVVTLNLHFANVPVTLPHDLNTGYDVYWEPLVKTTSEFGVGIDTINQTSESIEGAGSLTLQNDFDFWPANFDKLSFENQRCLLYSYHRDLDPDQARLIFRGKIDKQAYSSTSISFQLKDQFSELRSLIPLALIGDLAERTDDKLDMARQRMILGRVFGNVPTNIDQVLDGYPLTGTVSISFGGTTLTGVGTQFLKELSPDDEVILNGEPFTVESVTNDTTAVLTEEYDAPASVSAASVTVVPDRPKRHMNRVFKVAGHALRQAETTVQDGSDIQILFVVSTRDFYAGDVIYLGDPGSGERVLVESVIGDNYIKLSTSLATVPEAGTAVLRPAVQNVRIDNVMLQYERDYSFDAENAVLTLEEDAEANAAPIYKLGHNITITDGLRTVTGTGFQGLIEPGFMLGVAGNAEFFEVLSVESDTALTLRTVATFTQTATGRYKSLIYDPDNSVLSLDALGRTDDGTTAGNLLRTAPMISQQLLIDAGLELFLDTASFTDADDIAYQDIGIVIPQSFDDSKSETFRDVLNKINKSVFGSLVQTADFEIAYQVLQPHKPILASRFTESDILPGFNLTSTSENVVKTCIVEYRRKEYDYIAKDETINTQQKTSDKATYIVKTDRTKTISTCLVEELDAEIMANRWSFILSSSASRLTFQTKMQGMLLEVGSVLEIEHRKFFERFGSTNKRKLVLVESVKRSGTGVQVEATDLSNSFNRIACINDFGNEWADATETELLYGGFITDANGLIDNNAESFETNLIW